MRKRSSKRGHPDKFVFKDMITFEKNHSQMLVKHLNDLTVKLENDEVSVVQTIEIIKGLLTSLAKLKKYYENNQNGASV